MSTSFALHGFGLGPQQWQVLLGEKAVCPWLAGHGPNPSPARSFQQEVTRLVELAATHPGPRRLLGYSMGARLALGCLIEAPHLFTGAFLVSANPGLEDEEARLSRTEFEGRFARVLEEQGLAAFLAQWEALPILSTSERLQEDRSAPLRRVHEPHALARALTGLGLAGMPNYWPALAQLEHPITLIVGTLDPKFQGFAHRMAEVLPRAELHLLPEVGHNPLSERPELLGPLLDDFLAS